MTSPLNTRQEFEPIVGSLLKGATLVELEPALVERGDLRVDGGRIVERGADLIPREGDEVIALDGRIVMPGLVSSHVVPSGALSRGQWLPPPQGDDPLPMRVALRRAVEAALDASASHVAGALSGLEALQSGTTTLLAMHASPSAVEGSLLRLARGLHEVGVRAVLSYAVSDAAGAVARERALDEAVSFAGKAQGRFRGGVGIAGLGALSNEGLEGVQQALAAIPGGHLQVELAEFAQDARQSAAQHGGSPVERLMARELLGPTALIAHLAHLDWPELSQVIGTGAWLAHVARSNQLSGVGYAPVGKFGSRLALGTGELPADVLVEAQSAHQRACDAGQPVELLRALANGHRLASERFGLPIGPLREGAAADLLVLDYRPPTPLTAESLAGHLLEGLSSRHVESVMIDGHWRLWARRPLTINPDALAEESRQAALAIAGRLHAG